MHLCQKGCNVDDCTMTAVEGGEKMCCQGKHRGKVQSKVVLDDFGVGVLNQGLANVPNCSSIVHQDELLVFACVCKLRSLREDLLEGAQVTQVGLDGVDSDAWCRCRDFGLSFFQSLHATSQQDNVTLSTCTIQHSMSGVGVEKKTLISCFSSRIQRGWSKNTAT